MLSRVVDGGENMTEREPDPGSDEAVEQGCLCPVMDNNHGRGSGYPGAAGGATYWVNADCPLHGTNRERSGMKDGE
jgi:hypothetical protein